MNTFKAKLRSDKRANPEIKEYRLLTNEECKALQGHSLIVDMQGNIARVAITSIKTWKTRSDIQIGWKFGLYEFGKELLTDDRPNEFFVVENETTL